jgi:anti-sigma regulatory factor (Ser/Thr protein kinase)
VSGVCHLTLRNDRADLMRLAPWIDGVNARLGVTVGTAHAVHLCVEEAVLNVVSHAFEPGTQHEVRVSVWRDNEGVNAEVTDDGRPFDPLSYALPAPPTDLRSARIGGLGITLMRSFATRIRYQRSESMNRLLLSFPT